MSDGITITLGEYQYLRWVAIGVQVQPDHLYQLEHIGLVDIHDDGSVSLTPEGRLTLYPNP